MTGSEIPTPPMAARETTIGTMSTARVGATTTVRFYQSSDRRHTSPCLRSAAQPDTDSDMDVYGQKYVPSTESLGPPRMGISESSTPTFFDHNGVPTIREPYPAWSSERQIPLSKEEIEDIFLDLTQKFGFQRDSMRNMVSAFPLSHAPSLAEPRPRGSSPLQPPFPVSWFLVCFGAECWWDGMRPTRAPFGVAPRTPGRSVD